MKKVASYFLTLSVFIILSVGCERENFVEQPTNEQNKKGTSIGYVSGDEIPQIIKSITTFTGDESLKNSNGSKSIIYKKRTMNLDSILRVTNSDKVSNYTLSITVDDAPLNKFFNLIINKNSDGVIKKPYVVTYVVDDDALDNYIANDGNFAYFKGKRYLLAFDDFFDNDGFIVKSDGCDDGTPINGGGSSQGVDGNFYNMGPENFIQTNAGDYSYANEPSAGENYTLYFNSHNNQTGQPTSYGARVATQTVNYVTTASASPIQVNAPIGGGSIVTLVGMSIITDTYYSGFDTGSGSSTSCATTFVRYYSDGTATSQVIECTPQQLKKGQITKVAGDCPEDDGEIGITPAQAKARLAKSLANTLALSGDLRTQFFKLSHDFHVVVKAYLKENGESKEVKDFINDYIDITIQLPGAKFVRYKELKKIIEKNPWALLENCAQENGLDIANYQNLYDHSLPQVCKDRLDALGSRFNNQPISEENAACANMDYYSVEITKNPDFNNDGQPDSQNEIFQVFQDKFLDLASGEKDDFQFSCDTNFDGNVDANDSGKINWNFIPYNNYDLNLWNSNQNPVTTIIGIDGGSNNFSLDIVSDDGAIMISEFTQNNWIGSTVTTPLTSSQPFSGNRQWGILINQNGNLEIYTRAVDAAKISWLIRRSSDPLNGKVKPCQEDTYYNIAEVTWKNMQQEIANWINDDDISNGGQAAINMPKAVRVNKGKIVEILTSNESVIQILSDCN